MKSLCPSRSCPLPRISGQGDRDADYLLGETSSPSPWPSLHFHTAGAFSSLEQEQVRAMLAAVWTGKTDSFSCLLDEFGNA